jgi:hypothetical protein
MNYPYCDPITVKFMDVSSASLKKAIAVPVLVFITLMSLTVFHASAQSIPLPPPFPENSAQGATTAAANDRDPPKIEILTTELHEGKNVFKVRINDQSSLQIREIKYVQSGQLKIDGLFHEQSDVYDALINIHSPARIVTVTAGDVNGNTATVFREYEIKPAPDLLIEMTNLLSQIPQYIENLLGSK